MVATDGHRLAVAETDHTFAGLSNEARTLVPKKAMTEIRGWPARPAKRARSNSRATKAICFSRLASAC